MKIIDQIQIGSDPELFLVDEKGTFIPSFDLIGGSKMNPRPLGDGFFIQEDNAAAEFNVPPAVTKDGFISNIFEGIERCKTVLPKGLDFKIQPSVFFTKDQLDHYKAEVFGCEPDRNAWLNGEYNNKPSIPKDGLRCVGGHVHVGFVCEDEIKHYADVSTIKWMDILLGVPSMLIDKDLDRRRLYGKAGAYRDKRYGVEYRTLSSFWLGSKDLVGWVFDQTLKAVNKVNSKELPDADDELMVTQAINHSDKKAIDTICEKYQIAI